MENPTAFDLNRAIQSWREGLAQAPAIRSENLEELEAHLRDAVALLEARGLSPDEAFLVAVRRLGASCALELEYGKVNNQAIWLDRLFWMLVGYQAWYMISSLIGSISRNTLFLGLNGAGYDPTTQGQSVLAVLYALVQLTGFAGSLFLCRWLFCCKGQRFGQWLAPRLQHRAGRGLLFGSLYLLSLSVPLLNGGMQVLMANTLGQEKMAQFYSSLSVSIIFMSLIIPAAITWLTLCLARKRLRPA